VLLFFPMKRSAKTAFPEKYAAAVARKRAAGGLSQAQSQQVQKEVKRELDKRTFLTCIISCRRKVAIQGRIGSLPATLPGDLKGAVG